MTKYKINERVNSNQFSILCILEDQDNPIDVNMIILTDPLIEKRLIYNQLHRLVVMGLVNRNKRNEYSISKKGSEYLNSPCLK